MALKRKALRGRKATMIEKVKISGYRVFRDITIQPHKQFNLLVGDNESGKSTILEALALALTGRINGRPASEELNPYWFNQRVVAEFFANRRNGVHVAPPEIVIEVFLTDRDELQRIFVGAHNSDVPTRDCPGITLKIQPNSEYGAELEEHFKSDTSILPVEYYSIDWRTFGDVPLSFKPKELVVAVIDSRTIRSTSGVDFHLRQMLHDHLHPDEKAKVSLAFRRVKEQMTAEHLADVNERVKELNGALEERPLSLAMDQSVHGSWDASVVPHVADIPFAMTGQGQQATVKIALALGQKASAANIVMIEEPENHLSHTSLTKLLGQIEELVGNEQQLFIATHNSFVLNRLGLDSLMLVAGGRTTSFGDITEGTVKYFKKLPGYDTLRMVLADRFVLVEGPSDEIVFERYYTSAMGKAPIKDGIDVISMRGLPVVRCLELVKALGKTCAVLRDNDGNTPEAIRSELGDLLEGGRRELFTGAVAAGTTLEPQVLAANPDEAMMRRALGVSGRADLQTWMKNNKTEAALRLLETEEEIQAPPYFTEAIEFISGGEQ